MWIKFTIDFRNYKDSYWFLNQNFEHVGVWNLFYPTDKGFERLEITEKVGADKRDFDIHHYLFKVPTPENSPTTYYMRYDPQGHILSIDLSWAGIKGIVEHVHDMQLYLGAFFGSLLALLAYNFALLLYLRNRSYAYYVYYLGSFILKGATCAECPGFYPSQSLSKQSFDKAR